MSEEQIETLEATPAKGRLPGKSKCIRSYWDGPEKAQQKPTWPRRLYRMREIYLRSYLQAGYRQAGKADCLDHTE